MPLLLKDYTWRQTEDTVVVRVPIKYTSAEKVDLFTSELYIKVSYSPYLFEAYLYASIDEKASRVTLTRTEAVFELIKCTYENWPSLEVEVTREEKMKIKQRAIERAQEAAQLADEQKSAIKDKRQKAAVKEQIHLDSKRREYIDDIKAKDRASAIKDLETWQKKKEDEYLQIVDESEQVQEKPIEISNENEPDSCTIREKKEIKRVQAKKIPSTRESQRIHVSFTPRSFPTPCRESKLMEEEEWLKKQDEARRATGFVVEDLRPEEKDPMWLLEKGRSFFQVGNLLAAVSAYTHGIKLGPKIPELYVARSDAQVALGNFRRVVRDTTTAIELLRPHVEPNRMMRFASHYNRGRALLELKLVRAAEADLEEAHKLNPDHKECRDLFYKVEIMDEKPNETMDRSLSENFC